MPMVSFIQNINGIGLRYFMKSSLWNLNKLLHFTIFLLFFLPPLVFMPGRVGNEWMFIEYTHTKLAAILVLSWLFLLFFSFKIIRETDLLQKIKKILTDPFTVILGCFLLYTTLISLKSLVIEASIYELVQYWTCFLLFLAISALGTDKTYINLIIATICFSFFIVISIGFIQTQISIPWLKPVRSGANFPSTLGYKNPAALAITGQWFFLLYLGYLSLSSKKRTLFTMIAILALVEAGFIAALQSRTSYFAFFVTLLFLSMVILAKIIFRSRNQAKGIILTVAIVLIATATIFVAVIKTYPKAMGRFQMITSYLKNPAKYLESDRGTYLRNSINMANQNFFGVGIGNWRFAYPIYRKVHPKLCFNRSVQVQKAHCDYAQILGETGWPGFILWMSLIGLLLLRSIKLVMLADSLRPVFFTAQYLAFLLLMTFDYVIQMPYHKFAFFSVMTLFFSQQFSKDEK